MDAGDDTPICLAIESPFGWLTIHANETAIVSLRWERRAGRTNDLVREASSQLDAYFAGTLSAFDLPLRPGGDRFQQAVTARMCAIPYGQTRQYGEIAQSLGVPAQPVGQACGRNTIPIIVPCHRVVGAQGLGGFSAPGGIETKVALLRHEGAYSLLI